MFLIFVSCQNENEKTIAEKYNIEKIELKSFNIRGNWKIKLDKSLNATFENKKHLGNKSTMQKKIAQENYDEIVYLLNYIDFPNLKDSIYSSFSCGSICRLKITYDSGKIKELYDYGREENENLAHIYKKIEALNNTDIYTLSRK